MRELIYISHPCTSIGDIDENRKRAREYAHIAKLCGYHVINPLEAINPEAGHDEAMKIAMILLSGCDAILMCGEWWRSKGCVEEYRYALKNEIEIIEGDVG